MLKRHTETQLEIDWSPIESNVVTHVEEVNNSLSSDALRVLAFAMVPLSKNDLYNLRDMEEADLRFKYLMDGPVVLLGLIGFLDPPRSGVDKSIAKCKSAGVTVMMITGDQKTTATSIAKEIGVIKGYVAHIVGKW